MYPEVFDTWPKLCSTKMSKTFPFLPCQIQRTDKEPQNENTDHCHPRTMRMYALVEEIKEKHELKHEMFFTTYTVVNLNPFNTTKHFFLRIFHLYNFCEPNSVGVNTSSQF